MVGEGKGIAAFLNVTQVALSQFCFAFLAPSLLCCCCGAQCPRLAVPAAAAAALFQLLRCNARKPRGCGCCCLGCFLRCCTSLRAERSVLGSLMATAAASSPSPSLFSPITHGNLKNVPRTVRYLYTSGLHKLHKTLRIGKKYAVSHSLFLKRFNFVTHPEE